MVFSYDIVFDTSEYAEFTLYGYVVLVGILYDRSCECDILVIGKMSPVDHDRGEAHLDTALAELEAITMV